MPDISVIIPTRNRPGLLGRCLASLCEQTLDAANFEICVVNNGDAEMSAKVVALVSAHYPKHRLFMVDERTVGVAAARNMGLRSTTSPLVAMGDDDITVSPQWLEQFVWGFSTQEIRLGKIGGAVLPVWGAARPEWLGDTLLPMLAVYGGPDDISDFVTGPLPMGNGCYRREALAAAGNFPVTLGRKGNNLLSGEEAVDLVMQAAGWKLFYNPAITVHHAIAADRLTPAWWRRRAFWQGVSDYAEKRYLESKKVTPPAREDIELPLDRAYWNFINNAEEAPNAESLARLRGLGHTLAASGFIPV